MKSTKGNCKERERVEKANHGDDEFLKLGF